MKTLKELQTLEQFQGVPVHWFNDADDAEIEIMCGDEIKEGDLVVIRELVTMFPLKFNYFVVVANTWSFQLNHSVKPSPFGYLVDNGYDLATGHDYVLEYRNSMNVGYVLNQLLNEVLA